MVTQYGMSEALGAIDYGGDRPNPFGIGPGAGRDIAISEDTARQVDREARRLLDEAHAQARAILEHHRGLLDRMAGHLLEKEVLERDQLADFLSEVSSLDLVTTSA